MRRIIYHPKYSNYDLGPEHPFSPLRVEMVIDLLKELNVPFNYIEPEIVSPDLLTQIHNKEYVDLVEAVSKGEEIPNYSDFGLGTADNPIVKGMAEGARYLAGGALLGAKLLIEGKANKVLQLGGGFHHAHKKLAAGFCLYNDLALAIKAMTNAGWHVAYLDIDVHHGDGVQEIFYTDDKVMTISIHESGEFLFPGTGWVYELGSGMGRSLKLNLPLEPFTEGDSYLEVINKAVEPALAYFKPDALVVQTGADAHFADPLADLMLTTHDYEKIYRRIFELADENCKGRALFTLGGGYCPRATSRIWTILYFIFNNIPLPEKLPDTWRKRWEKRLNKPFPETLHDQLPAFDPIPRKEEVVKHNKDVVQRLMDAVAPDWL